MDKKISVIIPVYNVEKYLARCLNSIIKNTYKNIEIILVNDGSKDKSQEIIDKYKNKYGNIIKAKEQENKGPAEARNVGIEMASGEYLMFIDSDDFIKEDYIENYVKTLKEADYDLVAGGYHKWIDGKITYTIALQDEPWAKFMIMGPYTKLYKKSFLQENNIKFVKVNIGEDIYFNLQVNALAKKVKIIDYVGYYWYTNNESISNTMHKDIKNLEIDKMLNGSYDSLIEKNAINPNNKELIELYYYNFIIWVLQWTTKNTKFKDMSKEYDRLFKWLKERFPNYKKNKLIGINKPEGERFVVRIMFFIFMIMHKLHLGKIGVFIFSRMR
ncbi:MAG: glycosyltransferase family 2 protein [Clostridia bacterium]